MTIFLHELRQNRNTILIWTGAVAFLMMVCVFLFPEMKSEAESIGDMFSSMGGFTAAFGIHGWGFVCFNFWVFMELSAAIYWGWEELVLPRWRRFPHWLERRKSTRRTFC